MKKLILLFILFSLVLVYKSYSDNEIRVFSKEDISKLAGAYLNGNLGFKNPVFVDVDKDGDFDALNFHDGNVEYYKNIGTLDNPVFVLENKHYDSYSSTFFVDPKVPYPIFFADMDGDKDMDMFVVRDKEYNKSEHKFDYKIAAAENTMDLDTGTLITIILVLIIVVLVLAILGK